MNNKEYIIYQLNSQILLVVLLSYDISADSWNKLRDEIASKNETAENADVYIDYLLRNGLKDRFYKTRLNDRMLQFNTARHCDAPKECKEVSDKLFFLHEELLDRGILTPKQKSTYLKQITHNRSSYPIAEQVTDYAAEEIIAQ